MGDFYDKTDYLTETKGLLKDRINSLGGSITSGTTFRDYLVWLDSLYEALDEKTITGLPDSLEGKCEQEGTPTPTNPQPINITTGEQVVRVCGKNLLNTNTFVKGRIDPANGNVQYPDGITDFSTTNNSITFTSNATWRGVASDFIPITTGNYYFTMSVSTTSSRLYAYVDYYDNEYKYISRLGNYSYVNGDTKTWLLNLNVQNASFIRIHFEMQQIGTTTITNPQLEKGNNTTYEAYTGNTYEINLGKNLYYMNYNDTTNSNWNGVTIVSTHTGYSVNGTASANGAFTLIGRYIPLEAGTYTMVLENTSAMRVGLSKTNYASIIRIPIGSKSGTFTLTETTNVCFTLEIANGTQYDENNNIMIQKGNVATSYSPYKTPIYLGEMRNTNNVVIAKDYIFRNTTENPLYDSNLEEGQWYIHKEVGKVVCTGAGSEAWAYDTNNHFFVSSAFSDYSRSNNIPYCNYYKGKINVGGGSALSDNEIAFNSASTNRLYIKNSSITSASAFNTWLSTHNVEVYYVLNTPTNTLIEDEELINQLNEIEIFTVISEDFYN